VKQLAAILAIAAVIGFGLTALAQEGTSQPSSHTLTGKIVSVDAAGGKIVVEPKDGAQVTVATDAKTKVRLNAKDATVGDLKADMSVEVVKPATGAATEIRASTP
jgi:hypothetical protein